MYLQRRMYMIPLRGWDGIKRQGGETFFSGQEFEGFCIFGPSNPHHLTAEVLALVVAVGKRTRPRDGGAGGKVEKV